jgi:hypothetical protein
MALKKCPDCKKEFSSKAKACPHCGAPNKNHEGCFVVLIVTIIIGVFVYIQNSAAPSQPPKSPEQIAQEKKLAEQKNQQQQEKLKADIDMFVKVLEASGVNNSTIARCSNRGDTLVVVVANSWHILPYQIRLQSAQNLWKVWARIHAPEKPDSASISLTDYNENEVGGSRALGGIWVKKD